MWRKEGYHDDYTKSPFLPDDREDITEYVELLAMLHSPRKSLSLPGRKTWLAGVRFDVLCFLSCICCRWTGRAEQQAESRYIYIY